MTTRHRWANAARADLPALIAERDAAAETIADLERKLARWDSQMPVPFVEDTAEATTKVDYWIDQLHALEAAYERHGVACAALDAIGSTLPRLPSKTAPYWERAR